jgi:hypothetical protein
LIRSAAQSVSEPDADTDTGVLERRESLGRRPETAERTSGTRKSRAASLALVETDATERTEGNQAAEAVLVGNLYSES